MAVAPKLASLAVVPVSPADQPNAAQLAQRLGLPLLDPAAREPATSAHDALLLQSGSRLALQRTGRGAPGPVEVDFGSDRLRHRRSSGVELLGRAVGVARGRTPRVLDATAGLGRDAFILSCLGCSVLLCERNPVVASLLSAGLSVAAAGDDPQVAGAARRMRLMPVDARLLPRRELAGIDIISLDPMFPPRGKSAAVKKEMALFQALLDTQAPADAEELLDWALAQDVARIVVKRPVRAPALGPATPSHCIAGNTVRYDVYVRRALAQR